MPIFKTCALIGLSLWVGGCALLSMEEGKDLPEEISAAAARWMTVWGGVTIGALFAFFLQRHLSLRSLMLELPVGGMFVISSYIAGVIHPQIQEAKRKLGLPEFQGTAHWKTIELGYQQQKARLLRAEIILLTLGLFTLGLVPGFLR